MTGIILCRAPKTGEYCPEEGFAKNGRLQRGKGAKLNKVVGSRSHRCVYKEGCVYYNRGVALGCNDKNSIIGVLR